MNTFVGVGGGTHVRRPGLSKSLVGGGYAQAPQGNVCSQSCLPFQQEVSWCH